jgi:hypothetical protein
MHGQPVRQGASEGLTGLFGQVLRLCHAVGHDRVGVIAIDGTEIAANAS